MGQILFGNLAADGDVGERFAGIGHNNERLVEVTGVVGRDMGNNRCAISGLQWLGGILWNHTGAGWNDSGNDQHRISGVLITEDNGSISLFQRTVADLDNRLTEGKLRRFLCRQPDSGRKQEHCA